MPTVTFRNFSLYTQYLLVFFIVGVLTTKHSLMQSTLVRTRVLAALEVDNSMYFLTAVTTEETYLEMTTVSLTIMKTSSMIRLIAFIQMV